MDEDRISALEAQIRADRMLIMGMLRAMASEGVVDLNELRETLDAAFDLAASQLPNASVEAEMAARALEIAQSMITIAFQMLRRQGMP